MIVFDDMIADMLNNKKLNPGVTELFIRGIKLLPLAFIPQSYFAVRKNIRLYPTHYYIMEIPNKQELQQTAFNHLTDIGFQDFMNLYKRFTAKPYLFLIIDTTLASDNPLCNMILTERLQKYQYCHLVKLINMSILRVKKYYLLMKVD